MGDWGRPTAVRRALGQHLRQMRLDAEMTMVEAAKQSGFSQSKISKIESAGMVAKAKDVDTMTAAYGGVDDEVRAELHAMVREGRRKEWWEGHTSFRLPPKLGIYFGLEACAIGLRAYDPSLIHGLLQTPAYARAVIRAGRPELLEFRVEQYVESRVRRQQILTRDDPPPLSFWSIVDEAVLRRKIGGPEIMRAQLQHLVKISAQPNVTLQVLPDSIGAHAGLAGRLTILQFEPSSLPVVYVDGMGGNLYLEKPDDLERCQQTMNHILAVAPGPEQSLEIIEEIIKETGS